jgi:hypothetical protein
MTLYYSKCYFLTWSVCLIVELAHSFGYFLLVQVVQGSEDMEWG